MNIFTVQPFADLARYVRFSWVLEQDLADSEPYLGMCDIVFFQFKGQQPRYFCLN